MGRQLQGLVGFGFNEIVTERKICPDKDARYDSYVVFAVCLYYVPGTSQIHVLFRSVHSGKRLVKDRTSGKIGETGKHGTGTVAVVDDGEGMNPGDKAVSIVFIDNHIFRYVFFGEVCHTLLLQFPACYFLNGILFAVQYLFNTYQTYHTLVVGSKLKER